VNKTECAKLLHRAVATVSNINTKLWKLVCEQDTEQMQRHFEGRDRVLVREAVECDVTAPQPTGENASTTNTNTERTEVEITTDSIPNLMNSGSKWRRDSMTSNSPLVGEAKKKTEVIPPEVATSRTRTRTKGKPSTTITSEVTRPTEGLREKPASTTSKKRPREVEPNTTDVGGEAQAQAAKRREVDKFDRLDALKLVAFSGLVGWACRIFSNFVLGKP